MKSLKSNIVVSLVLLILLQLPGLGYSQVTILTGQAERHPWSSYWWQTSVGKLVEGYRGHPAPIEKYDLYVDGYFPSSATWTGSSIWYNPYAPSWYGLCHAWVNASILETMEIQPSSRNGAFFAIGDKKGLLCACHDTDEIIYKMCSGSPEYFHRYLLDYIGEQSQAIGADLDPSEEFWSFPIYKYEMEITSGETLDQVKCTIFHANDLEVEPDFCGTVEVIRNYEYSLEKDADGAYLIGSGQWLGASKSDHPNSVWVPVGVVQEETILDYETVLDIVQSQGDGFAENLPLQPGHFLLIPSPQKARILTIKPEVGEKFSCSVGLDDQTPEGSRGFYRLRKNRITTIEGELANELQFLEIESRSGNDEYELTLYCEPDGESPAFVHLYVDVETLYETRFHDLPTYNSWFGTAFIGHDPGRAWLQIDGSHGLPLAGGALVELEPAQRQLLTLAGRQTYDYYQKGDPVTIKLSSTTPLNSLFLLGNDYGLWGGTSRALVGNELRVVPWLSKIGFYYSPEKSNLTLRNCSVESLDLAISYFSDDGEPAAQVDQSLAVNEVVNFVPGAYPGGVNIKGWALLTPDGAGLDGCLIRDERNKCKDLLPLLGLGNEFSVIHLAVSGGWRTTLNLYNTNDTQTTIILRLHCLITPFERDATFTVPPWGHLEQPISGELWDVDDGDLSNAWFEVKAAAEIAGCVSYRDNDVGLASLALESVDQSQTRVLAHIANDEAWWTGMVVVNLSGEVVECDLVGFNANGLELQKKVITLDGYEKISGLAYGWFDENVQKQVASIKLERAQNLKTLAVYGTVSGEPRFMALYW
ncbi:hypothetical protein KAI46_12030 [bacterium]|nr:hypothetical protein [bacterium]